ncbi:hypothetical protein CRM22_006185 [Opisthorchis felineus]|uniref:Secreted protein n=1 Tax=Opisthorchis felineus TaxID=147828 RepID=A0A4V3SEJ9_OPIFE|nr:hypothetical protein CRM22_006185 [Opisthorchis felineus]
MYTVLPSSSFVLVFLQLIMSNLAPGFHTAETDFLEIDRDDYPRDDSGRILWCDYNHPRIHQRCVLGCLRCKRLLVLFYDLKRCCYACYRTNAIVVEAPPDRCTTRYFYDRMKRKQNV